MDELHKIFGYIMYGSEALAAIVSIFYLPKLRNSYWKYFAIYLVFIFLSETAGDRNVFPDHYKALFFNYIVIPIEFIFFYWIYAAKSFGKIKLFYWFTGLYIFSFILNEVFLGNDKIVFSFNYTFGALLLLYLVVMEYYKQVNSNDILNFSDNRMFYINWGVTLFYIGTLPLYSFWGLFVDFQDLFGIYFLYFQISGVIMYLLFAISIIFGKDNLALWEKQSS
ncbi:hypothetical protein [Chryseobacterium sp.]|uniref:hypothetical protein n=1 Tax=Chryseobacterium sp. TaxID=1871047 RepID=UPI0028A2B4CB|nr:hypothetical protein [Chryseobacterium sp.]